MITTLIVLAGICVLSLVFILIIPSFAKTKLFMQFLPEDIREAARDHPDPPVRKQAVGYLMTAAAVVVYLGALYFLGVDGLRQGYGFWSLFGRFMLFLYGYKLFDILVQDQYIVITRKYYVRFFPETKNCESWNNSSFNTKNQLIRLIAFPFVSALLAWITLMIRK